jgi:ABC-type multidrug transport system ATPase subunit
MSSRAIIASTLRKRFVDQALDVAHRLELPIEKPYGQLSKGNKQKLRLVLSFIFSEQERSELLALDEPLSGLDFEIRETVWELMDAARPQRQIIASMHPDRLRARPSAVLAITKTGELHSLPDPIPETWEAIESFLHERA